MKIKGEFILREIGDEFIAVSIGDNDFDGVVNLTSSGVVLWRLLEKGCTLEDLVKALLENYNIDEITARTDVKEFVQKLENKDLLI
jgi:hypothetical protein